MHMNMWFDCFKKGKVYASCVLLILCLPLTIISHPPLPCSAPRRVTSIVLSPRAPLHSGFRLVWANRRNWQEFKTLRNGTRVLYLHQYSKAMDPAMQSLLPFHSLALLACGNSMCRPIIPLGSLNFDYTSINRAFVKLTLATHLSWAFYSLPRHSSKHRSPNKLNTDIKNVLNVIYYLLYMVTCHLYVHVCIYIFSPLHIPLN